MPFGRHLDFDGDLRLSRYRGTIRWLFEEEPYMPDRVLRQFGRVQHIPADPIRPAVVLRLKSAKCKKEAT